MRSNEPFNDLTGYRDDYRKFDMPAMYKKPKDQFVPNNVPMDNLTTNRRDFTAKDIDPIKSFKPDGTGYRSDAPFDDNTTNKADFKKWAVQPMAVKKDNNWVAPLGEMESSTNYSSEYTAKPNQRAQAIRPQQRAKVDAKFEGDSTYGQDFRKWPGNQRNLIKAPNDYQSPNIPFNGASTYKDTYVGNKGGAAKSFKPDTLAYRSTEPFNNDTSYRTEYVMKELEKCPAMLVDTHKSGFSFVSADEATGHKYYAPNNNSNPVYAQ